MELYGNFIYSSGRTSIAIAIIRYSGQKNPSAIKNIRNALISGEEAKKT